jgi:protein-tyrosine phosphatase
MAEGLFRGLVRRRRLEDRFDIDSAGTAAYHVGELPDPRTRAVLAERGILEHGRARRVVDADFERFDHIFAMDQSNRSNLLKRCPPRHAHKVQMVLEPVGGGEVGDPYYGGPEGFEVNARELEGALAAWLERLL